MTQNYFMIPAVICVTTGCIILYNFLLKTGFTASLLKALKLQKTEIIFSEKVLGAVIFGMIPYLLFVLLPGNDPAGAGITAGRMPQYRLTLFLASLIVILLCHFFSGKEFFRKNLLQSEDPDVSRKNALLISAGWIIYLFGYELLFRGILFFACYRVLGFFPALIINLVLYALAHYKMPPATILGSVPAGIVFCSLSALMDSFLPAFILHTIMATGFTLLSLYQVSSDKIRNKSQ
jgi:membrane protease YdiL (CAAX protease family)